MHYLEKNYSNNKTEYLKTMLSLERLKYDVKL